MENLFSIGELAKYQNVSKQTLIYYDKIDLFKPAFVDPENGYRYYSADQLDYLDTILIMKKIGFKLEDIKQHMQNYTTENSLSFLNQQLSVLDKKIADLTLIRNRLKNRCQQVEQASSYLTEKPHKEMRAASYILQHAVEPPYNAQQVSIATKLCYSQALDQDVPIFFECGVSVPLEKILNQQYEDASIAFVTTDYTHHVDNIAKLPAGLTAYAYHVGAYDTIGTTYEKLLTYCKEEHLEIISDSYEFCINDYITSRYEDEFITKIIFYVTYESEH